MVGANAAPGQLKQDHQKNRVHYYRLLQSPKIGRIRHQYVSSQGCGQLPRKYSRPTSDPANRLCGLAMPAQSKRKSAADFLTRQDRALVARVFDIDDPEQIAGLLDSPPDTREVPEIEFAYNTTPMGGRKKGNAPHLKCVFSHPARHWQGSIVRWKNGNRARLGPNCGADHFGFKFKDVEAQFDAARSRKKGSRRSACRGSCHRSRDG